MALVKDLIARAKSIYGNDTYDYSLIEKEYGINGKVKTGNKFKVICHKMDSSTNEEHGVFEKDYTHFITREQGCPCCSGRQRYTTETIINALSKLDSLNNVTFEKVNYVNNRTHIICTCHNTDENGVEHGDFEISPSHALAGQGCPICRYIKSASSKRRSVKEIVLESRKIHGDKYDYSLIKDYKNDRIKYPIICYEKYPDGTEHGIFYQTMNNHIKAGQGCPICGRIKCSDTKRVPFEEYVKRAKEVHNSKYEYKETDFTGSSGLITCICPIHGEFQMDAANHLHLGEGCPKCANFISKGEDEIYEYIAELIGKENVKHRVKGLLPNEKQELDIYVPEKKFGIEFNGLFWHSEYYRESNYHLNKLNDCKEKGIRLFHLFEDEWIDKKEIVKSMISNILGKTNNKIFARKCKIKEIDNKIAREFLDNNHIQGYCNSKIRIGLFYNNELISIMTFGKTRHFIGNNNFEWELLRFCNKLNISVIGGASKLLKYFIKTYNPHSIVSYADKRWSIGNLYEKLGFEKYNESKPNYYYIIGRKRIYRFNLRKQVLIEKYGCPENMTEKEFCLSKHWWRIYDCGCLCYKLTL